MELVKVGVIGIGRMGQRHGRVYTTTRWSQLVGVYDIDPDTGEAFSREWLIPYFSNLDDLLDRVDAVSIAAPTPAHFELAMECLRRGVHVLVEKPMTETVEQAEALVEAAQTSGLVVEVGHIERFNPAYIELKNILKSMQVLAANFRRLSPLQGSNLEIDVIRDLMIHDLDLAADLFGLGVEQVQASGLDVLGYGIDHAAATLAYQPTPLVTITASRLTEHKVRMIEVTARDAFLELDLLNKALSVHRFTFGEYLNLKPEGVKYRQESIVERIHVPTFEPLYLELQSFIDRILKSKPAVVSPEEGLRALSLVQSVEAACNTQKVEASQRFDRQGLPLPVKNLSISR